MGFTGFYWVLLGLLFFLLGFHLFNRVLLSLTGFYQDLLGFTGFYRVQRSLTGFLLGSIGCVEGFTGFYWVLPAFN